MTMSSLMSVLKFTLNVSFHDDLRCTFEQETRWHFRFLGLTAVNMAPSRRLSFFRSRLLSSQSKRFYFPFSTLKYLANFLYKQWPREINSVWSNVADTVILTTKQHFITFRNGTKYKKESFYRYRVIIDIVQFSKYVK